MPHLALVEATGVLSSVYNRGPQAIAAAVEMLLNHHQLTAAGCRRRQCGGRPVSPASGRLFFRLFDGRGDSESRSRATRNVHRHLARLDGAHRLSRPVVRLLDNSMNQHSTDRWWWAAACVPQASVRRRKESEGAELRFCAGDNPAFELHRSSLLEVATHRTFQRGNRILPG